MRDHDADGAAVERAADPGGRVLGHAHERRDARIEGGNANLAGSIEPGRAVLQVNEQPVEAATRRQAGDRRAARMHDD